MLSKSDLSKHRQHIGHLLKTIADLSFGCVRAEPLIHGTPGEVYRSCGQKNCKCALGAEHRHGPYPVIQVHRDKKQRQMSIRKDQKEIWDKAHAYQKQSAALQELKQTCAVLTDIITQILNQRVEDWP